MKKLLSMILVLAMLCTMLALASCGDDTTDTSSEATGSEESVAPPTNAELLESAIDSLDAYTTKFADVFAIDLSKFESETGNANVTLSLDELSAMGENMFGEDPLKIGMEMALGKDATQAEGILYAAGDEVKLEIYTKGDKQYISFPELYEDTFFDAAEMNAEDAETETEDTAVDFGSAMDDITAILLKEENITISEDGKIYTITLGEDEMGQLLEIIEPMLGTSDGMDDIVDLNPAESSEPEETTDPDNAVIVLDFTSETQASVTCTFKEGETAWAEAITSFSSLGGMTTVSYKINTPDSEILDLTMSATETAISVEGNMNLAGTHIEIELDVTNENNVSTIDGTLSLTVDMSGMLLTIPFEIDGTFAVEGETLSMAMSLSASIEGMMNIGLSIEMDYTPADVTVTLPFDESDVAEYDEEDFAAKMEEVYPGASALMGGPLDGDTEEVTGITYAGENTSMTIYTDNTVELVDFTLTYEKTDNSITFYKNGEAVYTISYSIEDDTYVVYGQQYDTATGTVEDDGYLVNFYYYYDNNTYLDVYLYDDTNAGLSMCYQFDPTSDDLIFTLPSGETLTYDIEMSDDGMTVTVWGETLSVVMDAANF